MLSRDRIGSFVAVLLGTTVVAASLLLFAAAEPRVPDRFAGSAVVVQSPSTATTAGSFTDARPWSHEQASALAARLSALDGVTAAVADHTFYAQPVLGGRAVAGSNQGQGWASAALAPHRLTAGTPPRGERDVIVDRGLGVPVGASVNILTARGPQTYVVSGLIAAPTVYVADPVAARLAPGVRSIGLTGRPEPGEVAGIVGAAGTVLTGTARGALEPRADARTRWIGSQVLTAMVALSAFMSVFVVSSTFAFTVNQRRREWGLLRAAGATPRQVRRIVHREALAVGAAASTCGVLLGAGVAPLIATVLVDVGLQPPGFSAGPHAAAIAAAWLAGPVASVLGAWSAARRAARVRPVEALRRAVVEPRPMTRSRWIAGLVAAASGAAAAIVTAAADDLTGMVMPALLGAMALVVAAALLAPVLVPALVRVLLWPAGGMIGTLVRENALTAARRTASTATPVLLTVAFAVFITGTVQTTATAYAAGRQADLRAGAVLVPDGTPGLSDAATSAVTGAVLLPTELYVGTVAVPAVGVDPASMAERAVVPGAVAGLTARDAVIATDSTARRLGWRPGAAVSVTFADGRTVPLRVQAVVPDRTVPAQVLLHRRTVRAHDPSALATAVFMGDGAVSSPIVGARIRTVAEHARLADAEEDRLVWIFTLLLVGVSAGFGAMAVVTTLSMAAVHRRRDVALLRLAGASPWQVLSAVAAESALVVAIGAVLGTASALLALRGSVGALSGQVGVAVSVVFPWPVAGATGGLCLVLAVAAGVLPLRSR